MKHTDIPKFNGFKKDYDKNFFKFPTFIIDERLAELSNSEFKVLVYILRKCYGFSKTEDYISLSQFTKGSKKQRGTGLSVNPVCDSLKSLEEKGYIITEKRFRKTTLIKLNIPEIKRENTGTKKESKPIHPRAIEFIEMFEPVCGYMTKKYIKDKKQLEAMSRLLENCNIDYLENIIYVLPETKNMDYCPVITSPVELENKIASLNIFIQRRQNEGTSEFSQNFKSNYIT